MFDYDEYKKNHELLLQIEHEWAADDDFNYNRRQLLVELNLEFDNYIVSTELGANEDELTAALRKLHELYRYFVIVRENDYNEIITRLTLEMSLCPLHLCDYESCFMDENPECKIIRLIHPNHDT